PSGRGVSRGAVEVSCAAGGALRVRPAAESEWLTCGAGSRVSACGKYADLCSQRTTRARGARTTTIATTTTVNAGQPKAVMAAWGSWDPAFAEYRWKEKQKEKEEERKRKEAEAQVLTQTELGRREDLNGLRGEEGVELSVVDTSLIKESETVTDVIPNSNTHTLSTLKKESQKPLGPDNTSLDTESLGDRTMSQKSEKTEPDDIQGNRAGSVSSSGASLSVQAEEREQSAEAPASTTVGTPSSEVVDSQHIKPQSPSENAKDNSNTNDGNSSQNPSPAEASTLTTPNPTQQSAAAPGTTSTSASQENGNADSTATTTTNSEAPTTTLTPSPVPNADINNIASTVQNNKANVDSTASPVWMRTAAPLLIVAVLFSVTMY
ncbi:uncharacterized protein TM35_000084390, partial [Trypanosoma theileri]